MIRTLTIAAIAATAFVAQANATTGYVFLNQPGAAGNATLAQFAALGGAGAADITFNFNGTASFTGSGDSTVDTINSFIATGGVGPVAGGTAILNNSYFYFTGTVGLNAGNNVFTITHDDGFEFNIDGIGTVVSEPGPTPPVATTFNVNAPAAGTYTFQFSYGETAGGPAQITVLGGTLQVVPEAGSLAVLAAGMGILGLGLRRRAK